ncbi:MAG TPA: hypothetical protein VFS33_11420 [Gemmatimonadales bacterium]|nr:hypothetical protein [Gemmatimonadales bacterium]
MSDVVSNQPIPARKRRWGRGSVGLALTALALLPAAAVGRVFDGWDRMPPIAQWAVIGIGAACTIAVVYLIFTSESEEGP